MDYNIISDHQWDAWAKELLKLQTDYPEISKNVIWYEAFKDWDASTGAFLPLKDQWVVNTAKRLISIGGRHSGRTYYIPEPKTRTVKKSNTGVRSLF